ncbi:MAG: hypothetical protein AB4042_08920 [Leptolyngbyaceae cyanobacterium]
MRTEKGKAIAPLTPQNLGERSPPAMPLAIAFLTIASFLAPLTQPFHWHCNAPC